MYSKLCDVYSPNAEINYIGMTFTTNKGNSIMILWNEIDGEYMFLNQNTSKLFARCERKDIIKEIEFISKVY